MLEPNRLFFALWPTDAVRVAAHTVAKQLKVKNQPSGYLSALERHHITLLFLGDFVSAENEAAALKAAATVRSAPFTLRLDQAGSFRNAKIPWWLGPREMPEGLTQLHQCLHDALMAARVVPERMKFVPHLTILRDAGKALPVTPVPPLDWEVQEFVLVRSRLDLKPVQYELLGRWPLAAGAGPAPPAADQIALF